MKIFLAGATGVLGRETVRQLVAAGHEVRGSARAPAQAAVVRGLGAEPVEVDLYDVDSLQRALQGCDVAIHMATHVPRIEDAWRLSAWNEHNRLRQEATPLLVQAAAAVGVRRVIKESVAFSYPDGGDDWITEDVDPVPDAFMQPTLDGERATLDGARHGIDGVVLRFGFFYGPGCRMEEQLSAVRSGVSPLLGSPDAYQPAIHIEDAAAAVVAALEVAPGVYNIADEPLTKRRWVEALAEAYGSRRKVRFAPPAALKLGGKKLDVLTRSQRVSSERFSTATGWRPQHRSAVEGLAATAAAAPVPGAGAERVAGLAAIGVRLALVYLAISQLLVGIWACFFPRSFYDDFPGLGMVWVSVDGPYNEHLVRDTGAWSLGLAVLVIIAAVTLHRTTVLAAAIAVVVATVPHTVYHARHTGAFDSTADALPSVLSLTAVALVALGIVVWAVRSARTATAHR